MQVGNSTSADTKAVYSLRSSVDSYASKLHTQAVVNYRESNTGWQQQGMPFHILHSPNASAGTTIHIKYMAKKVLVQHLYILLMLGV